MKLQLLFSLLLVFTIAACGNGERIPVPPPTDGGAGAGAGGGGTAGGGDVGIVSSECEKGELIDGSQVRNEFDLAGIKGARNIAIRFCLDDGGKFNLHTYGSNNSGSLDIRFTRTEDRLTVTANIGADSIDYTAQFAAVDASKPLHFYIDVHNGEAVTHLLIWPASAAATGFKLADTLVDSGGGDGAGWFGSAGGKTLGYSGSDASLVDIAVSGVKYAH